MPEYTLHKDIDAPAARVFAISSDFENAASRVSGIQSVEVLTDGPVGIGTRFKETRVIFKREATEEMEVVEFEPPHRYRLLAESCGTRYETDIIVTPDGDDRCRLEFRMRPEPLTRLAKVLSFVMRPMIKSMLRLMDKDLEDVKRAAESQN